MDEEEAGVTLGGINHLDARKDGLTVGELLSFLSRVEIGNDAGVVMEVEDEEGRVSKVPIFRMTAAIGFGEESRVIFRLG
jgi:hypothetical protein